MQMKKLSSRASAKPMRWRLGAVAVTAALGVAGVATIGGVGASSAASAPPGVQKAVALVAALQNRPTSIGLTTKIKGKIPSGKHIYYVDPNLPSTNELVPFLQAAAKVLGWTVTNVPAGLTPETYQAAYDQVVRDKPAGVFSAGIAPDLISADLATLAKQHRPVVFLGADAPEYPGKNVALANIYGYAAHVVSGDHQADWVIADSGGTANTVFYDLSSFKVLNSVREGFQEQYDKLCSSCGLAVQNTVATDIGTNLPGDVVSYLRANPSTHYVVFSTCDQALGVPSALASAGFSASTIKLVCDNGEPTDLVDIQAGNFEAAATTFPAEETMWRVIDIFARTFAGDSIQPSVNAPWPTWILTHNNVSSWGGPPSVVWPLVKNFAAQYEALWPGRKH
jgi:ABC-type sugar transport system substrate-binding protein